MTIRPDALQALLSPDGPLVMTSAEVQAMPVGLREQMGTWLMTHRTAQADLAWHVRSVPPSRAGLTSIGEVLMRTVADPHAPMVVLDAWLRAYSGDASTRGPFQHPADLVTAAVGSRRLDVLATVLGVPAFCPVERHRETWPTMRGPTPGQQAWLDRHGKALFNGGLSGLTGACRKGTTGVAHGFVRTAAFYERLDRATLDDPFLAWAARYGTELLAWQHTGRDRRLNAGDAPRARPHINLVGLAVMMGWAEGVRTLLDHGVDPDARDTDGTPQRSFMSPVILAAHYGEMACLVTLLRHPSFDLLHRYGYTAQAWDRLTTVPDLDGLLWVPTHQHPGGMDLEFVLRSPLVQHPEVREALVTAYSRLLPGRRQRLTQGLTGLREDALQAWETVVLVDASREAAPEGLGASSRPRARL